MMKCPDCRPLLETTWTFLERMTQKEDDFYINVKEVCQMVVGCSLDTYSETVYLERFYILTAFCQELFASV